MRTCTEKVRATRGTINGTPITVEVARHTLTSDPPLDVYEVVVSSAAAEWRESFGSREALSAFLRGLQAGASFSLGGAHFEPFDVP